MPALAKLQGSEKQIEWAMKIRSDRTERWRKSDPYIFKRLEKTLEKITSSTWWIAYRNKEVGDVLIYVQNRLSSEGTVLKTSVSAYPSEKKAKVATGNDSEITRFVGELRHAVTGELVVDPDCPF